jgi:manganese/zinc/iron transport system permease protein
MNAATDQAWLQAAHTILIGMVVNAACALVGCWLVLRRLSLLGDAISHAVLPGIALAFLLTGQVTGMAIIVGAMLVGLATAFLTQTLRQHTHIAEDASLGVVFTALFAIGVLLINYAAHRDPTNQVDLDPGCVLYGAIDFVAADTTALLGFELPRVLPTMLGMLLVVLAFIVVFWKELKLGTFDSALAAAMGLRPTLMHYLLMALTAGVTVTSFEAVGSILVIAMLIVPPATAQLLTEKLSRLLVIAALAGMLAAALGYGAAVWLNTNVAGMMAVAAGAQFGLAVLFAPKQGVVSQLIRRLELTLRIAREDVLSRMYRREEQAGKAASLAAAHLKGGVAPRWLRLALRQLKWRGELKEPAPGELVLTERGRGRAAKLVRTHRLWERFLEENVALPLDHLHAPAERIEHFVGPALLEELAELAGPGATDPHGRTIPAADSHTSPSEVGG